MSDSRAVIARRICASAAVITSCIGVTVLLGWALDVPAMRTLGLGVIVMIPNTATGMVLGGLSLWLLRDEEHPARRLGLAFASFIGLLGAITFIERTTGWNAGIDLLLFAERVKTYPYLPPGRMATNSTVCFTLAGIALLSLDLRGQWSRLAAIASTLGLAISGLALFGYLYGVRPLYAIDQAAGMAFITALGFFSLHLGVLFARPSRTVIPLAFASHRGGLLIRELLPVSLVITVALGALWIRAREANLVSREGGVALFVLLTSATLIALALRAATLLHAADRDREDHLAREIAAREAAEEANRHKSDFLAVMSHELRTPLNAIMGYSNLLADGILAPIADVQRKQLDRIDVNAQHLLGLIEDVLTLSRPGEAGERLLLSEFGVRELMEETIAIVEPLARKKSLVISWDTESGHEVLTTDRMRLRQVLVNLLTNSVKFTPAGTVRFLARAGPDTVEISVRDPGIGMTKDETERAFEPFWQAERSRTRVAEGAGLGLAISKRLVERLGGRITLTSATGAGTLVRVVIPRQLQGTSGEFPRAVR